MELIETPIFTKQVQAELTEDDYRALQLHLVLHPGAGDIIPGSGGLRKFVGDCPAEGSAAVLG
jgi:hypothetical protein